MSKCTISTYNASAKQKFTNLVFSINCPQYSDVCTMSKTIGSPTLKDTKAAKGLVFVCVCVGGGGVKKCVYYNIFTSHKENLPWEPLK